MNRSSVAVVFLSTMFACNYVRAPQVTEETVRPIRDVSYAQEKAEMIYQIDRRMNDLVARYSAELTAIHTGMQDQLAAIEPPARLVAIDRGLRAYGAAAEERYETAIERLVTQATDRLVALVGRDRDTKHEAVTGEIEEEAWRIAREVGGQRAGADSGYGFVSGVRELDARVEVTLEQLKSIADVRSLEDMAAIRRAEVLQLSHDFHHDITPEDLDTAVPGMSASLTESSSGSGPRVGRFFLFRSGELENQRFDRQDSYGVVVAFQNERIPLDHRLGLVQAARHRVVRGGMIVEDFGWTLDPQTPNGDGRLPNNRDSVDPRAVASECMFPAVNVDHSLFRELRDFQVIYDYKTALYDETQRRVLGALSWQVTWSLSRDGQVRLLEHADATYDARGTVVSDLLQRGSTPLPGKAEPTPNDLAATRYIPVEPSITPLIRDLGNGRRGPVATTIGADHMRVSADARRFLGEHRFDLLAQDARFQKYLDGVRGRYVLRLVDLADESPWLDLGFRGNDDIHAINDQPIRHFQDLWTFLGEHPRERRYEVLINRAGALRKLVFDVEGVPAASSAEPESNIELTEEMVDRLNRLFTDSAESE